ncbi:heat-inducible transcriptional repressor HrcA [Oceanobacillus indicireducens]|uniref:Heat-inducible transcription repressor HrcA n=1 Tax=Oceanobacillus indicireducens TaxID=1004261 RepID=A0A918D0T4_9BACI|nr:heat-inducible transcriptional repressor HrcA [Oceanobacillus indicireducens]GGN54675.1 heat-inducible transcription repressor HrcA [Oceanobacillus indicireducens]
MLTERQLLLLQVIIDDFIDTAHPVGSRVLAKKGTIPFSAATIRNEMADLEELGFLEKMHSSSGRIPSEKGYRYYVDHLIKPVSHNKYRGIVSKLVQEGIYEFEQIVQMSAEILSELTSYTAIILGPEIFETQLKQLQIVPLSSQTAVAVLVTNTGHVEHRMVSLPEAINASDLEKLVNIINQKLVGIPIVKLQNIFYTEMADIMKRYLDDYENSLNYLKAIFLTDYPVKVYVSGTSNMLMQPEFNDIDKVRSFYTLMDKEDELIKLLKDSTPGIEVTIGNENEVEAIKDFSLITSSLRHEEEQIGTIALLGPKRMEYRKVISLLKGLSNEMTNTLYMWYKDKE